MPTRGPGIEDSPGDVMRAIIAVRRAFPGTTVTDEVYATPYADDDAVAHTYPEAI